MQVEYKKWEICNTATQTVRRKEENFKQSLVKCSCVQTQGGHASHQEGIALTLKIRISKCHVSADLVHNQAKGIDTRCYCLHFMGLCLKMWMVFADNNFPLDRTSVWSSFHFFNVYNMPYSAWPIHNPLLNFFTRCNINLWLESHKSRSVKNKYSSAEITSHVRFVNYTWSRKAEDRK